MLRDLAIAGLPQGLSWSNEVSELMLYLITMCVAPWLLRQGQHIKSRHRFASSTKQVGLVL
jgi:TRAP-type C4-dicarboxylate transport system permease small subunit